jgi:hypothetical protein
LRSPLGTPERRVRAFLGVALAIVAAAFIVEMSERGPRLAGSDRVAPAAFAVSVLGGATICQPISGLPGDAAQAALTIGTYGLPAPRLSLRFLAASGVVTASGSVAAGGPQGVVSLPISHVDASAPASSACLSVGPTQGRVAIAGYAAPAGPRTAQLNRTPQPAVLSLLYYRAGRESWWSLLPTLAHRFGLGKAPLYGDWTLPLCTLMLLGVWIGAVRLMLRELR